MKKRHVLILVTPAYQPRLAGIARYARQHGWQLTILDRIARQPKGWNGDGVLVTLREDPMPIAFVKSLRKRRIPVVDLTFNHPEMRLPRVSGDHFSMGKLARQHFEERNFHNFAWFDRWLGDKLNAAPKPLALLAYDDADAARALGACHAVGLSVPEDVSILGIGGDRLLCENQPIPLSSVEHDQGRTGYEGAALLDRLMDGEKLPHKPILIPPRGITVRTSSDSIAASSPIVRRALEYIRTHLDKPFGLAQIAAETGVSRATIARLFEQEFGRPAGAEILRQRMNRAKRLLKEDFHSVAEVAFHTGFCNPAYFTNTFRRVTGMSPKAWRLNPSAHSQ